MLSYVMRNAAGAVCCTGPFESLCESCKAEALVIDARIATMARSPERCTACGGVLTPDSKPAWTMPDGRTSWETYWASMPDSIREALGLSVDDLKPRPRDADRRIAPPLRLSERLKKGQTTPTPTTTTDDGKRVAPPMRLSERFLKAIKPKPAAADDGSPVPAPRRLSSIFAEKG
jgi:hypothetical protein